VRGRESARRSAALIPPHLSEGATICRVEAAAAHAETLLGANMIAGPAAAVRGAPKAEGDGGAGCGDADAAGAGTGAFLAAVPSQAGMWQPAALPCSSLQQPYSLLQPRLVTGADGATAYAHPVADTAAAASSGLSSDVHLSALSHAALCGGALASIPGGVRTPIEFPAKPATPWWPAGMSMQGLVNFMVSSQIAAHLHQHVDVPGATLDAAARPADRGAGAGQGKGP
jgi:hypothetical protein